MGRPGRLQGGGQPRQGGDHAEREERERNRDRAHSGGFTVVGNLLACGGRRVAIAP
jgi:hypothetical protein